MGREGQVGIRCDLRHGLRVARTEVLRSWRWLTADWRRAIVSAFLFVSLMSSGLTTAVLLYFVGRVLASGAEVPSEVLSVFRIMVNSAFLYLSFLFAGRAFSEKGGVGNRDLLLTTVSPASVVVGTVTADFLRAVAIAGPLVLLLATAFGIGLGSLLVFPAVVVSFFLLVALSVAFGYAAGFVVKLLLVWLPSRPLFLKWSLRAVALAAGLAAAVVLSLVFVSPAEAGEVSGGGPLGLILTLDFRTPLTVYAEAFFVGTPLGDPGLLTAASVLCAATAVPLCVGAATRVAPLVWYSGRTESSPDTKDASSKRPPDLLSRTKTLRITWRLLLRGRRNLMGFTHLIAPLLLLFSVLLASAFEPSLLSVLGPPVFFLAGAYLSGAAFGLNALGEEGEVLHVLLTSPTPGRCFVRAHVLAGLLVGFPMVLASLAFAPFNPLVSPVYHVLLVGFGLYFSVCCAAIAVGLGFSFPRFESVHPDYDLYPPTTFASTGYLGAVFLPGVFALVLLVLPKARPDRFFAVQAAALVGLAVLSVVTGAVAYTSYVYSVRRFDSYTFD